MPVALTSTSTSPAFGPWSSTVSMVSGAPAFQATAAFVFTGGSDAVDAGAVGWGDRKATGACARGLRFSLGLDSGMTPSALSHPQLLSGDEPRLDPVPSARIDRRCGPPTCPGDAGFFPT